MDARLDKLKSMRSELFDIANSYAGNVTGTAAANLHNASNVIQNCIRMIETGITSQDHEDLAREWLGRQMRERLSSFSAVSQLPGMSEPGFIEV